MPRLVIVANYYTSWTQLPRPQCWVNQSNQLTFLLIKLSIQPIRGLSWVDWFATLVCGAHRPQYTPLSARSVLAKGSLRYIMSLKRKVVKSSNGNFHIIVLIFRFCLGLPFTIWLLDQHVYIIVYRSSFVLLQLRLGVGRSLLLLLLRLWGMLYYKDTKLRKMGYQDRYKQIYRVGR